VPVAIGDVTVTFAGSLEVPARVVQLHPFHNLALVAYDPASIGDTPVVSASFNLDPLKPGDEVLVVGMKADHQLTRQESIVASVDPMILPLSRTLRFRDANIETVYLVNAPDDFDGVLVDRKGRVLSTWSSFMVQSGNESAQFNRGIPSELVAEFVATVKSGQPFYSLEAEFVYMPLFAARNAGLDEEWLDKLERNNPIKRRALSVTRLVADTPAARELRNGDIVLAVNGDVVTSYRDLEKAVRKPTVTVTVWRDGDVLDLALATAALDGRGIDRVVAWGGALLQNPHRAMAAQRGIDPYGVYVAFFSYGSPATRYGLYAGRRVIAVDDTPTPDLETFVEVVTSKQDRTSLRIKTVTWNGSVDVITLKPDNQYWSAYDVHRTADG
jgi:S1-C subfamily serine protease